MKLAHHGPIKFVDDGYPEAEDYANNYIPLPPAPRDVKRESLTRSIVTGIRILIGRLRRRPRRSVEAVH